MDFHNRRFCNDFPISPKYVLFKRINRSKAFINKEGGGAVAEWIGALLLKDKRNEKLNRPSASAVF